MDADEKYRLERAARVADDLTGDVLRVVEDAHLEAVQRVVTGSLDHDDVPELLDHIAGSVWNSLRMRADERRAAYIAHGRGFQEALWRSRNRAVGIDHIGRPVVDTIAEHTPNTPFTVGPSGFPDGVLVRDPELEKRIIEQKMGMAPGSVVQADEWSVLAIKPGLADDLNEARRKAAEAEGE